MKFALVLGTVLGPEKKQPGLRAQIRRVNRTYWVAKDRKDVPSSENGMCKGPGAGAQRAVGARMASGAGPRRPPQHAGEFCFISTSAGNYGKMRRENGAGLGLALTRSDLLLQRSLCLYSRDVQRFSGPEEGKVHETWPFSQGHSPGEEMEAAQRGDT